MTATAPDDVVFRHATIDDVDRIVSMLANDALGAKRERFESPLPESYTRAFEAIDRDPNNELVVACLGDAVVGVLQITFIPYLTYQGGWRAQVEGVRVHEEHRSSGLGRELVEYAGGRAEERGCHVVQLTTDKTRSEALRFYERLGFIASHEGMKLHLRPEAEPAHE